MEVNVSLSPDVGGAPEPIRVDLAAIFVSLELSRATWLVTSLSPGAGQKMSRHVVRGGDAAGLLNRLADLRARARARTGKLFPVIVIQEAGLDGFWLHRVLEGEGIESHVVDPPPSPPQGADDGPRPTGSMAKPWSVRCWPTSAESRACVRWSGLPRLRRRIAAGCAANANAHQRACPARQPASRACCLRRVSPTTIPCVRTGATRLEEFGPAMAGRCRGYLKAMIERELGLIELLIEQIDEVRRRARRARGGRACGHTTRAAAAMLLDLKGVGPGFAGVLWSEGLFRQF